MSPGGPGGSGGSAPARPFASNQEHLEACCLRADLLLRAQVERWRAMLAEHKPAEHWGMVLVSDAEVDAYLAAPYRPPGDLPDDLEARLEPLWERAGDMARAIAAREAVTPAETGLRLRDLAESYGLSAAERDAIALCLLLEQDERLRRLVGYLRDDATRRRPSVELMEQVLRPVAPPEVLRLRLADGPLRHGPHPAAPLLRVEDDGEVLADRAVRLADRVATHLFGSNAFAASLDGVLRRFDGELAAPPPKTLAGTEVEAVAEALGEGGLVLLNGPYGSGRRRTAGHLAAATGRGLLLASVPAARARPEGWGRTVDGVFREGRLAGAALAWTGCEDLLSRDEDAPLWRRLVERAERHPGSVFLVSELPWEPSGAHHDGLFLRFDLEVPGFRRRRELWARVLDGAGLETAGGETAGAAAIARLAEELANGFQLTPGQIDDAVASARGEALRRGAAQHTGAPRLRPSDLFTGCRRQSGRLLTRFARRIEPRRGLDFGQLVLPRASRRQLDDLRLRIRHRSRVNGELGFELHVPLGRGLVALFSGSSGTGKTFAAELLAGEQGVDLYKVDLSAVVSKYVGETEKNLERVFAQAERANAMLFFDEADALFGKRGEVKEARDRWANLEVNYLLQRVEEYPGVVILTTNLRQNIDPAFLRRIQVLVEFPFPDEGARFEIWRRMFPDAVGRPDDAVLRALAARFRLPGGGIKNVVLDAAHRAVAATDGDGRPLISERHLGVALVREYQKLGKPVTRSEFGADFYALFESELA